MNRKKEIKVCFVAAAVALLVAAVAAPAGAWNLDKNLYGDYAMNGSYACAYSTFGFDPSTLQRKDSPNPSADVLKQLFPSITQVGSAQGVYSFNGHGGLTFKGEVLTVEQDRGGSLAPTPSPVSQWAVECTGTYEVDHDLSVTGGGDCKLTPKAGPLASTPIYLETLGLEWKGQLLGTMGSILMLRTDTEPNIEIVKINNIPNFPGGTFTMERICTTSGTVMKIVGPSKKMK